MKKFLPVLALTAVAVVVTTAYAAVTFDPSAGTGWVGKGDVQLAFGLNNKAMQDNHTAVTFEYDNTTEYSFECEWYTGPERNRQYHSNTFTRTTGVQAGVASDSRRTGQWTGWYLTGFLGQSGGDGNYTPSCPGNDGGGSENSGVKTIVEGSIVVTPLGGGLYAVLNGDRRQIQ